MALWAFLVYMFLPIELNIASGIAGMAGLTGTSELLFQYRYASLVLVVGAAVVVFFVVGIASEIYNWFRPKASANPQHSRCTLS